MPLRNSNPPVEVCGAEDCLSCRELLQDAHLTGRRVRVMGDTTYEFAMDVPRHFRSEWVAPSDDDSANSTWNTSFDVGDFVVQGEAMSWTAMSEMTSAARAPRSMWDDPMPCPQPEIDTTVRRVFFRANLRDRRNPVWQEREIVPQDRANLVSSIIQGTEKSARPLHAPVIDLDFECRLVPSSTPGHYHLYLDRTMTWEQYESMLYAMMRAGVVERGFYDMSRQREASFVRKEGVFKEDGDVNSAEEARALSLMAMPQDAGPSRREENDPSRVDHDPRLVRDGDTHEEREVE